MERMRANRPGPGVLPQLGSRVGAYGFQAYSLLVNLKCKWEFKAQEEKKSKQPMVSYEIKHYKLVSPDHLPPKILFHQNVFAKSSLPLNFQRETQCRSCWSSFFFEISDLVWFQIPRGVSSRANIDSCSSESEHLAPTKVTIQIPMCYHRSQCLSIHVPHPPPLSKILMHIMQSVPFCFLNSI